MRSGGVQLGGVTSDGVGGATRVATEDALVPATVKHILCCSPNSPPPCYACPPYPLDETFQPPPRVVAARFAARTVPVAPMLVELAVRRANMDVQGWKMPSIAPCGGLGARVGQKTLRRAGSTRVGAQDVLDEGRDKQRLCCSASRPSHPWP